MIDIKFSKEHIEQLKKFDILAVYLFGSQVRQEIHPMSDVDFGVIFENPGKYKGRTLDIYLELYDIFTDVLPKDYLRKRFEKREHEFDLVFLQFVPISLQFNAVKEAKILYESDETKRLDYEEYVMKRHSDLKYLYDIHMNAFLERI